VLHRLLVDCLYLPSVTCFLGAATTLYRLRRKLITHSAKQEEIKGGVEAHADIGMSDRRHDRMPKQRKYGTPATPSEAREGLCWCECGERGVPSPGDRYAPPLSEGGPGCAQAPSRDELTVFSGARADS
jgi:hypothetical protein